MSLLTSLAIEKERWQETSENFKSQMSTLIGDVFLSAAFLSYAGYFDQQSRQSLFTLWKHHLEMANIAYRGDIARTEFLSDPDERIEWQANKLPSDDLCTENAIMLKRFNRYPLIIDPSGQATEFIMNEYEGMIRDLEDKINELMILFIKQQHLFYKKKETYTENDLQLFFFR